MANNHASKTGASRAASLIVITGLLGLSLVAGTAAAIINVPGGSIGTPTLGCDPPSVAVYGPHVHVDPQTGYVTLVWYTDCVYPSNPGSGVVAGGHALDGLLGSAGVPLSVTKGVQPLADRLPVVDLPAPVTGAAARALGIIYDEFPAGCYLDTHDVLICL